VILKCTTLRRSWARRIRTESTLNRTVATVKKSSDTSSPTVVKDREGMPQGEDLEVQGGA
jgi:hypothetical protein